MQQSEICLWADFSLLKYECKYTNIRDFFSSLRCSESNVAFESCVDLCCDSYQPIPTHFYTCYNIHFIDKEMNNNFGFFAWFNLFVHWTLERQVFCRLYNRKICPWLDMKGFINHDIYWSKTQNKAIYFHPIKFIEMKAQVLNIQ